MKYILIFLVLLAYGFIFIYSRAYFFKEKRNRYASSFKRWGAFLIDKTILGVVALLYFFAKIHIDESFKQKIGEQLTNALHQGDFSFFELFIRFDVKLTMLYFLYALVLDVFLKGTLGKKMMNLQVKKEDGNTPSFLSTLIRAVLRPISITLWPLFIIFSRFNTKGQWMHDLASRTVVIEEK